MHEGQDQPRPCTTPTPSARIGRCAPWPKRYAATAAQLLPSLVVANRMLATFGSRQPSESLPRSAQRADQCCQVTYAATYVARSPVTYVAGRPVVTWHVSAQRAYVDQADLAAALSSMGSPGLCHVVGSTHSQRQRIQPAEHQQHRRAGGDMGCAGGVSK